MKLTGRLRAALGAARLDLVDVLTAAILLAILLYAASRQFPAFENHVMPAPSPASQASRSP